MVAANSLLNKGLLNIQLHSKHFQFFSRFLNKILLLVCFLCLSIVNVWAEGSKELNPVGGDRVYLQSSTTANANVPFPSQGLVRVYAKPGEVLYLGSSAQGVGNGTISVIAPNGTIYNSGTSTTIGRINSRTQEVAGPVTFTAGGYTPYTLTVGAAQEGVWSIFFISPGNNSGGTAGSAIDAASVNAFTATQRGNTEYIIAFDVSVRNTANTAFIQGRAYMNGFAASMQAYNRKFKSTFYVQTFDGYLYEVIPQDKTGYIFNFFSNNKGVRDASGDPTYKSFNSTNTPSPNIHNPFSEDTGSDVTHKIFFNNPAADLPTTAPGRIHGGAYPAAVTNAGTFWLKKEPKPPYASDVTFVGKEGTVNKAGTSPLGGYIHFKTNQPGSFFVNIDVDQNGSFTDPIDVKIEGPAGTGDNVMYWDGKNGLGNQIYGNIIIQPSQMNIVLRGGEVHFPFMDVENNLGGIIIKRMNGVEDPDDMVYWDDSDITFNAGAGPPNPIATGFMGVSSSINGHKWGTTAYSGTAFGNEVVLDTWSYILSRPVIPYMDITFRESDLEVVSLVSSKDSYCVGEEIIYTLTVRNNGPDAVEGATLFFNHPSQFLINGLSYTTTASGTHSFISSNSTTYTTSLNLANQEVMTFVFKGKLTDYINTGQLNANAIIMRPRDVTDPNATNPDDAPPTDPFLECPAGNCGNNYKEKNNITINKVEISIYSASVTEGNSGNVFIEFPVELSAISSCDIYVDFKLEHLTTNNDDFLLGTTGTLTIPAGTLNTVLQIKINPDLIIEGHEQFKVVLSKPSGGNTLAPIYNEAIGLIRNDDEGMINLMAINGEEESILPITKHVKFIFSFPPGIKSDTDTEIFYVLSGSADGNGIDYIGATGTPAIGITPANPRSIVIPAGDQSVELILPVVDDEIVEGDEEINIDVVSLVSPYAVPNGLSITFTSAEVKAKIVDNDVAVLTLSAAIEEEEGDGPPMKEFVYTLSLDKKTKSGFSVDYSTFNDGATLLDNDYELSSGFLVFEKDSIMTDTIRVTVNGDNKIEADERFKLILSNLSNTFGGRLTLSHNETYGKIINDDFANIRITPDDGKEGSKSVEFRFELEDGKISDKDIVIHYKLEGGTAASGSDYDGAITGTITILAGSNYATLVLPAKIDGIIEGNETVILEVTSVSTPYPFITVINPLVTANIEDIDTGSISIGNAIIDEGHANTTFLNFPVTLSHATQEDVEITFSTQDFTAFAGEDYIAQINQTLVFTKTPETKYIRIEIKGDKKIELNEIFYVLINHIDRTFGGHLTLGTSIANGTITNDDSGAITIEPHDGEEENEVAGRFIFKLPQDVTAGEDITITYSLSGTATRATTGDYTVTTYGTFILPAGTNSKSLDILVIDDEIIEGTESVIINIVNVSSIFPSSSLSTTIASQTLNIIDNDTGIITLIPPVNTNEGALGVNHAYNFGIRLDKATQGPFVVKYHTEDGTASIANVDYAGVNSQITFPSNTANHTIYIPVTIYGDNIIEANETFRFILDEIVGDYGGRLTIVNGAATSIIINDDIGGVSITPAPGTEGGANPSFTFSLPPGIKADQDIEISYSLGGDAVGNGSDFAEAMSGKVTILAGDNAAFLQLTLVDDAVVEGNEQVNLTVTNFVAPVGVTLIDNSSSLTILDNDNAVISINSVSIAEGMSGITDFIFNVSLDIETKESFSLKYSTIANSAFAGEDYVEIIGGDLGFDGKIGTRTITIQVKGDKKVELNERFYVDLFGLTKTFDGHLTISTTLGRATGTIVNDDIPKIIIVPTDGDEDGLISGVFRFKYEDDYISSTDTEIRYDLFGSAVSLADYDFPTSGVFIIPAGSNYLDVILPIIQDEIVEHTETVGIVAEINSALAGITFPVKTSQLNIFDDDVAKITVSVDPASVNETNFGETTTVRFTITLDKQTKTGFSLSYYTQDISTDNANDYNPQTSSIGFLGNTGESKHIDVVIKGDNIIEPNEQFQLIIDNLTENFNNRLTIAKDRETATILNDDFGKITIIPTHAVEGSVDGAFTFRLPAGITVNENVDIYYQLSSSDASAVTDYNAALFGSVRIDAGQNEVSLPIPIINDNVLEIQESLTLTITSIVSNHGITAVSNVSTITIDDDDTAIVTLIAPTNRTEKDSDEETVTFLVRINQPIGLGVNIPFNSANVSATDGEDYTAVNSTLHFPISNVAQELAIEVKIKGDKKIEKDEVFNLILGVLSQNFEGRLTFNNNSVPYTIINDDQSKIIVTKYDGKEGNTTDPYFRFSLENGYTSDEPITFNYDFQGGANALDYTTTNPTTINIPANGSYVDVIFKVIDDEIVEHTETIAFNSLSISSAYSANITLDTAPRPIVNIEDNDDAELILTGTLRIKEGNTGEEPEAIYTIELTKSTQEPFNINLATAIGTALSSDFDFIPYTNIITHSGNKDQVIEVRVKIIGDTKVEADENFTFNILSITENYGGRLTIPTNSITTVIENDDNATITITPKNGAESLLNDKPGAFTFSLPSGITVDKPIIISYSLIGKAQSGSDYVAVTGSVTLPAGANSVDVIIDVIDDTIIEGDENLILTASISSPVYGIGFKDNINSSTLIIEDNDYGTVSINNVSVLETHGGTSTLTFTVTLSGDTQEPFKLYYETADDTAKTSDDDYVGIINGELTINQSASVLNSISVTYKGDKKVEADETFKLILKSLEDKFSGHLTLHSTNHTGTATLENDDSAIVRVTAINGKEDPLNNQPAGYIFTLVDGLGNEVSSDHAVQISYQLGGTAQLTESKADYTTLNPTTVTILAGSSSATVYFNVIDDAILEVSETIILENLTVNGHYADISLSPATLPIARIEDNDVAKISLTAVASMLEGHENEQDYVFTISLDKETSEGFNIGYTTADGTALSGEDYTGITNSQGFNGTAGESYAINVRIKGDHKVEPDEVFNFLLDGLTKTFEGRLTIETPSLAATITNDDSTELRITKQDGEEGASHASFTFSLTNGKTVDEDIYINYSLDNISAILGNDYTVDPTMLSPLVIPVGSNSVTLTLTVIDDTIIEGTETVSITAQTQSNPRNNITVANSPQTLQIFDNDTAQLSISNAIVTEGNDNTRILEFDVSLNYPTQFPFTVNYYTEDISATAGVDYTAVTNGSITFNALSTTTQKISITVSGDRIIEADETLRIIFNSLVQDFEGRLLLPTSGGLGTIVDNDLAAIIITKDDGEEDGPKKGFFKFSLPSGYSIDKDIDINYNILSPGSTADADDYLNATSGTITIDAGDTETTLWIDVKDDNILELDETVILTASIANNPYPTKVSIVNSPISLTIKDNDYAKLTLTGATLIKEEDSNSKVIVYTVKLDNPTKLPFDITYSAVNGTAEQSDADYLLSTGILNFNGTAGEERTFTVAIIGDTKIEADETFSLVLSGLTQTFNSKLTIEGSPLVVTIQNDDSGQITITKEDGAESLLNDKPGAFTFSLPSGITVDKPIIISYSLIGKAQSGSDYEPVTGSVTLPAGANSVDVIIDVIDDTIIEGDENLILTASISSPVYGIGFKDNINSSTLIIKDNDYGTVSINNVSVLETHGGTSTLTFTVTLSGDTQEPFKLYYETADDAAKTSDDDYVGIINGELTINQSASVLNSINVTYKGDKKVEADETFKLILKSLEDKFSGHLTLHNANHTGTATLENDDSAIVRVTAINGKEDPLNNQPAGYIFTLVDGLGNEVSSDHAVQISYQLGGTAQLTGPKTDYTTLNPTTVTILSGSSSATVYFNVVDDAILEFSETITLENLTINGYYGGITLSPAALPVARIEDNDTAKISLTADASMLEGHENEQDYVFTISLDKETSENFIINYQTTNGTAISGEDYTGITNSQGFNGIAGESYAINVRIKGDHKVEPDEVFNFLLDGLTKTFEGRLTIETPSLAATITNDDSTELRITKQDGEEGASQASFTFSLTNGKTLDTDLYIRYTFGGLASQGVDYTLSQANPILLPKGQNSIQLLLSVVDDNIIEDVENVTIEASIEGINPYGIIVSNNSEKILNIWDNDKGTVTIDNVRIVEGDTGDPDKYLVFTVSLSNPTALAFNVKYNTENVSATAPADYIGAINPLTDILYFTGNNIAGETRTISIPVKGDFILENDEDFYVHLNSLSENFNNRLTISTPKGTGTIEDNDAATLIITKTDGKEQGTVPVTFTFSFKDGRTSDKPTVISYKLEGTALSGGVDFTGNAIESITIPAGQPSVTLTLPVKDDAIVEGDETVKIYDVVVSSIYNSRITLDATCDDAIIEDNDWAKLSINGPLSVTEGNAGSKILTFEVSLDVATAGSFDIKYRTQDQTAISTTTEKDFEEITSTTFNFSGVKDEKKTINVIVYGDTRVEEDEYFNIVLEDLSSDFYGRLSVNGSPARGNIIDDDNLPGNKTITITKVDGEEKPDGSKPASFTFSFPPGISLDTDTEIFFSFDSDATAKNVEDYNVLGSASSIIIRAGENSRTLTLNVIDDLVIEDTETVTIVIGNINNHKYNGITVSNPRVSLNIADNDSGTLNISSVSLPEGHSGTQTFNFTVSLSNPTSRGFTVNYKTKDGTATIDDEDYVEAEDDLIFSGQSGQTQTISVTIKGDRRVEQDEFFEVLLSQLSDSFNGRLTIPVNGKGTILNDDSAEITVTKTDGKEGGDPVTFILSFPNGVYSDKATTIHYRLVGDASGNGIDYFGNIDTLITIPAYQDNVVITLPVVDDLFIEENETVIFQIKQIDSFYGNLITYNPVIPVAIIQDNDVATLSIDGPITVKEGDFGTKTVTFNVTLDRHMGRSFQVSYETVDGTAKISDDDYVAKTGTIEFAGNINEKHQISIEIKGDRKVEGDEDLLVRLFNLTHDFDNRLTILNSPAKIIIEDDDNIEVNKFITITKQDGEEKLDDSRSASFTFSLPAGVSLDEETRINYSLDGSAKSDNEVDYDYQGSISAFVTIPAGQNSVVLTLPINDDDIVEETEIIRLTTGQIENETYNDIRVVNSPQTVNIIDNDYGVLRIDDVEVVEGDAGTTAAIFRVHLSKATSLPFTVDYSTENGTATVADADYNPITGSKLSFAGTAGEIREIRIHINGDRKIEADETFKVLLSNLSNTFDGRLTIERATAVGTIKNDDNAIIKVTGRDGMETGPQSARFIFSFPAGYTADIPTVIAYRLGGTAIAGGTDYTGVIEGSITIPAGDERVILDLPVIDDEIVEDDEIISIIIKSIVTNYSSNITYDPLLPTVKIIDNDRTVLKLSDPITLDEGNSGTTQFVYTVTLEKATGKSFTIKYRTTDGTASLGDNDYMEATGTLSFSGTAGETRTVVVFANGDLKIEANEIFNFIISDLDNNFNNRLSLPLVSASVGIIKNDDGGLITITKIDGKEGEQDGRFIFTLPPGVTSDKDITINYRLSGTAGTSDYSANPSASSITIPAGENSVFLDILVNDDNYLEQRETVILTVTRIINPYNNVTIAAPIPVLYIYDNDFAEITVSSPVPIYEGNTGSIKSVKFNITLDKTTDRGFTIIYNTVDGTAKTVDNDYQAKSGKFNFSGYAGETKIVEVFINGDIRLENDETFELSISDLTVDFDGNMHLGPNGIATILNDDVAPNAVDDYAVTPEDTPITFSITENDTHGEGVNPSTVIIITQPEKGKLVVHSNGTVTYSPYLDLNGEDYFVYTVKDINGIVSNEAYVYITILPVNDPPVANDDVFYVEKGTSLRENVSLNDTDPDGDVLSFELNTFPTNGNIVFFDPSDGGFIYIPNDDFKGKDTFKYSVYDTEGLRDEAEVTIYVQPRVIVNLTPNYQVLIEGDSICVTATISEFLYQDVNITLGFGGTAEVDKDYTLSGNYDTIIIPAGDTTTTQKFCIKVLKDFIQDDGEMIQVRIVGVDPSEFITVGKETDILINDFYPVVVPPGPGENGDISPDPYLSPNGDGLGNEKFVIYNIEKYPDNEVIIFNRWGNEVYRMTGYNNHDKSFVGVSNSGLLSNSGALLVDGVYYFIIYTKPNGKDTKLNKGYIIMKR